MHVNYLHLKAVKPFMSKKLNPVCPHFEQHCKSPFFSVPVKRIANGAFIGITLSSYNLPTFNMWGVNTGNILHWHQDQ